MATTERTVVDTTETAARLRESEYPPMHTDPTRCADCDHPIGDHAGPDWLCRPECDCGGLLLHEPGPEACPCGETHPAPETGGPHADA